MRKIGRFLRRHLKAIIIIVIAIIAIIVLVNVVKHFTNGGNSGNNGTQITQTSNAGKTGIVTIDGQKIGVFDNTADAKSNTIGITAGGVKKLKVSGKNANASTPEKGVINQISDGEYELSIDHIADCANVMITVKVGGDGSFVGNLLGGDVETYYFVLNVSNPDWNAGNTSNGGGSTPDTTGVPTGTVHFGDAVFQTYGSENEAQSATEGKKSQFTIPTSMAQDFTLTADPSEGTARIWCYVGMVDGDVQFHAHETRLNADSNWSGKMDISEYAGHQVTIVLHAEGYTGTSNGYSYVSFFVPEI